MKTGFSLLEILHGENPVFITGMGLQCGHKNSNFFTIALIWGSDSMKQNYKGITFTYIVDFLR